MHHKENPLGSRRVWLQLLEMVKERDLEWYARTRRKGPSRTPLRSTVGPTRRSQVSRGRHQTRCGGELPGNSGGSLGLSQDADLTPAEILLGERSLSSFLLCGGL
jgi:hypothetical protein